MSYKSQYGQMYMKNQQQEALERRNNKLPKYARKGGDKDTDKDGHSAKSQINQQGADTEVF